MVRGVTTTPRVLGPTPEGIVATAMGILRSLRLTADARVLALALITDDERYAQVLLGLYSDVVESGGDAEEEEESMEVLRMWLCKTLGMSPKEVFRA